MVQGQEMLKQYFLEHDACFQVVLLKNRIVGKLPMANWPPEISI
jgi:hypothetical protein